MCTVDGAYALGQGIVDGMWGGAALEGVLHCGYGVFHADCCR